MTMNGGDHSKLEADTPSQLQPTFSKIGCLPSSLFFSREARNIDIYIKYPNFRLEILVNAIKQGKGIQDI